MKKVLYSILAASMAFFFVSCSQKPEEPAADPIQATLIVSDVTVEEGKSVYVSAATNSTASVYYVADNSGVYTLDDTHKVTGVKAGSGQLTVKVDAVEGKFTSAEKTITVTVTAAPPVEDKNPKPGNYTFTASDLKGKWVAGDQIYIQGGYGPTAQVITLEASQLSADGKTATVALDGDLFKYFASPDPFYAVWPASAVKKQDGLTGPIIEYSVFNTHLTQAYLKDSDFAFKDITSAIFFTVSGDYDRVIIAGTQRPGLRFNSYKTEYSSAKVTPAKPKDDGYPFREEELSTGENSIYFPGGITFTGGFTLYFASGDNWTASYTYSEEAKLKPGQILELGDISGQLEPYEGGKPHMPEVVNVTKYAVSFNEFSGLCLSEDASFLWTIDDNGKLGRIDLTENVGTVLESWSLGGDPEGISIHPETGDLIIGNEEPVSVGIVKAPVSKGDKQTIIFKIYEARGYGNAGMEGITYYKKDGDKDLVYCGAQTDAMLFLCDLNAPVDGNKYTTLVQEGISLRKRFTGVLEIAGLSYDPLTDWLWMVDSEAHKIFVFSGDASQLLCSYTLKTRSNEEGIVVDHSRNCVWIADDYGSTSYLYKYEFSGLEDFIIEQ